MFNSESDQKHYQYAADAIRYIQQHAHEQPSLTKIAEAIGLSEYHLQRIFTHWAGVSPKRFLQFLTKERALTALKESGDILHAALDSGLSGPGRLHDLMVSCVAMTPGEIKVRGQGVELSFGFADSPFGRVLLAWTPRGICHLSFIIDAPESALALLKSQWLNACFIHNDEEACHLANQVFQTKQRTDKLTLLVKGTNFQLKVWEALLNTEPGQLVSYSQLAELAGSPKAQRAVGSAVANNNIGWLIPCHRVIRESGDLGNYRWGTDRKMAIQAWEACQTES